MSETHPANSLLFWLSGADPALLGRCRRTEILHYNFKGAYLGLLGLLTAIAMAYFAYRAFGPAATATSEIALESMIVAIAFGLFASLLCLSTYRLILLPGPSVRHEEFKTGGQLSIFLIKLLMATLFGICVGIPVSLFFIGNSLPAEFTPAQLLQRNATRQEIESRYRERLETLYLRQLDLQEQIGKRKNLRAKGIDKPALKARPGLDVSDPDARVDAPPELLQGSRPNAAPNVQASVRPDKPSVVQSGPRPTALEPAPGAPDGRLAQVSRPDARPDAQAGIRPETRPLIQPQLRPAAPTPASGSPEEQLAILRAEIASYRAQLRDEEMRSAQPGASVPGVIELTDRMLTGERMLCLVLIAIVIFFYAGPILAQEVTFKGPYDFAVEYENIRCLATHRIVPHAHTVWLKEAKYEIDRYLNPETLLAKQLSRHRRIREDVTQGLFSCLADQKVQYQRASLTTQE